MRYTNVVEAKLLNCNMNGQCHTYFSVDLAFKQLLWHNVERAHDIK